jgi:translation initiation factor 1
MSSISDGNSRLVYSSEGGRVAPAGERAARAPAGGGDGIVPPADVAGVARELKRLCGSGGAVKEGVVEIQGDHRERVIGHLRGRYRVKAAGG